jgi:hypothetical protein
MWNDVLNNNNEHNTQQYVNRWTREMDGIDDVRGGCTLSIRETRELVDGWLITE